MPHGQFVSLDTDGFKIKRVFEIRKKLIFEARSRFFVHFFTSLDPFSKSSDFIELLDQENSQITIPLVCPNLIKS
jgi:hypothetical protein